MIPFRCPSRCAVRFLVSSFGAVLWLGVGPLLSAHAATLTVDVSKHRPLW